MNPLFFAKLSAVFSVFYAGVNVMQLWSKFTDVRERAQQFTELAGNPEHGPRLRWIRGFFYFVIPLAQLASFFSAGLPTVFVLASGLKFSFSAWLGIRTEKYLLGGGEYRPGDHRWSQADAILNILAAVAGIFLILRIWIR